MWPNFPRRACFQALWWGREERGGELIGIYWVNVVLRSTVRWGQRCAGNYFGQLLRPFGKEMQVLFQLTLSLNYFTFFIHWSFIGLHWSILSLSDLCCWSCTLHLPHTSQLPISPSITCLSSVTSLCTNNPMCIFTKKLRTFDPHPPISHCQSII